MKGIIAALEAKRHAARADGGEKRHDAQRSLGKLSIRFFSSAVAVLTLVASALFAPRASALGTPWVAPKNDFVLSLPEGWERDAPPANLSTAMLTISARPTEPFRACAVTGEWTSVPLTATQDQGNRASARAGASEMRAGFPTLGRRIISYSNQLKSGVQVSSIVFEYQEEPPESGRMRSYGRNFIVIQNGEFRFYTMNCGVRLPATDDEFAVVQSFMDSLTFTLGLPP